MIDKKLSVVVPCYLDADNIVELLTRLKNSLNGIIAKWEVIYVNDASPDHSAKVLEGVLQTEKNLRVITFSRNFGVMSAFHAGMRYAEGDAVVIMDGDLQDPPELIPRFLEKWSEGYSVVYGTRPKRDESFLRQVGYKLFYRLWSKLADITIPEDAGEFALMDRRVVDVVLSLPERDRFLRGLRSWAGFSQTSVEYLRPERFSGESTQSYLKYIGWSLKAIRSFSYKPLRFVSVLALSMFGLMTLVVLIVVSAYLSGAEAPAGFFTIVLVVLFGSATQLFALAILSEYMISIFEEVKGRPHYVVESVEKSLDGPQSVED